MKGEAKMHGLENVLRLLQSLPAEVVSKRGGPVKKALAKGARLLRDEAKRNLRAAIANNGSVATGLLEQNVIASRGKEPIGSKGERYLVRVRQKVYPGRDLDSKNKPVTTRKTAALLEYGSEHQPATPWLRPAVQAKGEEVIRVVTEELNREIEKVIKKLARQQ